MNTEVSVALTIESGRFQKKGVLAEIRTKRHTISRSLLFRSLFGAQTVGTSEVNPDIFKKLKPVVERVLDPEVHMAGSELTSAAPDIEPSARRQRSTNPRVGLITGSSSIEKILTHLLKKEGCNVVHAGRTSDVDSGIFWDDDVRVVIVDCSGKESREEICSVRSVPGVETAPVIVITDTADEVRCALAAGAAGAFLKPFDLVDLIKAARGFAFDVSGKERQKPAAVPQGSALVVSDAAGQLIALGSALFNQGGYEVMFGRGTADALEQAKAHEPAIVLIDMSMEKVATGQLLKSLSKLRRAPKLVLIADPADRDQLEAFAESGVATVLESPVNLLTLSENVLMTTGIAPVEKNSESAAMFRNEILRVLR